MEHWKQLLDYPSYEISDLGRIRNKATGVVLKPMDDRGYLRVNLYKNGKLYRKSIHRQVLLTFMPSDDPENKWQVNHKDGNKKNNRLSNLEWCTPSENTKHAIKTGLLKKFGRQKTVVQLSKEGNVIARFKSAREAARQTGVSESKISCVCTGYTFLRKDGYKERRHTAGGFNWRYE